MEMPPVATLQAHSNVNVKLASLAMDGHAQVSQMTLDNLNLDWIDKIASLRFSNISQILLKSCSS